MTQASQIPPIRLEFVYTVKDIRRAVGMLQKNQRIIRLGLFVLFAISCVVMVTVAFYGSREPVPGGTGTTAAAPAPLLDLLMSFGPYVVIFVVLWVVFYQVIRRRWAQLVPPGVQRVMLSDEGMIWDVPGKHVQIQWSYFRFFDEDSQAFLLGVSPMRAELLPKRVMTPQQVDAIRQLLLSHISKKTHAFPVVPLQGGPEAG